VVALEQYADQYNNIRFERRNGILQMTFHTNGGPLQWGSGPHEEFPRAFADVGSDRENRVIIVTGTGDAFSGPQGTAAGAPKRTPQEWDKTYWEGKKLLSNLLDIEVPMIAAVNGPALRHSEIPLLCDIVLAADTAAFQDLRALYEQPGAWRRRARRLSHASRRQQGALLPAYRPVYRR
jgi:enoyl-CoA hydratase/carnithine racemase